MQHVIVGTDGSDTSMGAVREAAEIAGATGATLHIACSAHVAAELAVLTLEPILVPEGFDEQAFRGANAAIGKASEVAKQYTDKIEGHVLQGDAASALIGLVEETNADLLVVGSRGMTGAARFLVGSVANRCAHHAPCSVLIARTTPVKH